MQNFIQELRWRGMIHDMIPGTEEQLSKELTSSYIGFEPTATSLHIGNLATIMLLKHFQLAGHKPIALVGGATGMIGDPSGRNTERPLLDRDTLFHNQSCIQKQLSQFLDFESGENSAVMLNNYDWFKEMGFLSFLREVGKHLPVNYMMAKDSVKSRLETGISFTEFTYQLLQGYDFYYLYTTQGVKLQMGGADQWGNLTTGTELIRRKANGKAYALTTPLVTKSDGTKFGKTAGGAIWLDPAQTSPYKFYQFFLNCCDEDTPKLLKIYTLLDQATVEDLIQQHEAAPHKRLLQQTLAKEITQLVHSKEAYEQAAHASNVLFGQATSEDLNSLDESTLLAALEGVPQTTMSHGTFSATPDVITLVSSASEGIIFSSKGEARKMIQGGGLRINKLKVDDPQQQPTFELLHNRYLVVQKGKKNYYLIIVE